LILIILLFGITASACGGGGSVEPAALPAVIESGARAPVDQTDGRLLPTAAATLIQPASPTPAPTAALDPVAAGTAAIEATRTAAASPPTPPILASPTTGSPLSEPLPTPMGVYSRTLKVPILMYHYISEPPPDSDVYRVDLSITPDMFRRQMAYLRDNGYTTINFYELTSAIVSLSELPEKPVLLTFDDGYLDNYENAYPTLKEFGFEGTFFIVTEFVDKGREGYMTWPMIEEMAQAGHSIESHSRTHPELIAKSHDSLIWEILGAQETIAAHTGQRPRYFCYPGGYYDEATIQMLVELDYWGAVTPETGSWHGFNDRFEWRRVRMRNTTTMEEFAHLVDLEGTVHGKPPG
jgi:peptidoglycan/xylan/chitin deacetylase (PgdA/CDA1 family)